jgi:serine/threonine protein kinase
MVQFIGKRYQIQRELGVGGMGAVYLGLDSQTNTTVAIKHLKRELAQPEMIERFKREGEALRDLNHPNIVKLLDTLEHEGQQYLIMEYVAGGDLKQLLEKGKLPYTSVLNIAMDLADALTRAHRLNIIHRDLKPANVLVANDGTIRLTDFGVAHVVEKERVTEADAIVGTLDYLPPEAINGDRVDQRSDIWAFGVMLFEMLAGKRPFSTGSYLQTLHAIMTVPIPDLEALAPDAPTALVDLVYRMLIRDPQARISSVRYVGAELEEILQGRENRPVTRRFETPIPDFRQRLKHNLPAQTTPFVGRKNELDELARMLSKPSVRLVTILAQGGMGKTRISLEAAERQVSHFEHGVYFVELAPLAESENMIPAITTALNYQLQDDGREPKQQLLDFLQAKELLLVLDNFEHLIEGASLVSDLLKAAPKLKILVTSRQRLDQTGETLFHLSGMDVPKWETPKDALNYAAVKLFMHSASRAKPDFELTTENLDYIARICKLVQGMPLGIVLAASWLGMLSPKEVSEELQKGLDFLESDSKQIPQRQRSMRAVMDYSWQQMNTDEQVVFAKLSVFRGGFTREAAEAVAGVNLRILMSLVNKSLLHRDSETGRYEIHELLRQYAEEQLIKIGSLEASKNALSDYYARRLFDYEKNFFTHRFFEICQKLDADYENLRIAWNHAIEQNNLQNLYQMILTLQTYVGNYHLRDFSFMSAAAHQVHVSPENEIWYGRLLWLAKTDSDAERAKNYEVALRIARESSSKYDEALSLFLAVRNVHDIERANEMASEILSIGVALDDNNLQTLGYNELGYISAVHGKNLEKAISYWEEAMKFVKKTGDPTASTPRNLTLAKAYLGDREPWRLYLHAQLEQAQRTKSTARIAEFLGQLSDFYADEGNLREVWHYFDELLLYRDLEVDAGGTYDASISTNLAYYRMLEGDYAEALDQWQKSEEYFQETKHVDYQATINRSAIRMFIAYGLNDYLTIQQYFWSTLKVANQYRRHPMNLLTLLTIYHFMLAYEGQYAKSVEIASIVLNHLACLPVYKTFLLHHKWKAEVREQLSDETFAEAWERGKSLDLETVIQETLAETE